MAEKIDWIFLGMSIDYAGGNVPDGMKDLTDLQSKAPRGAVYSLSVSSFP